jgi:hypothetical protein
MLTQAADLAFGITHENTLIPRLQSQFHTELLRGAGKYSRMDYHNPTKTLFIELKSRRIRHDAYPTAIIGLNKVEFCADPAKEYYFVFNYTDGLYYIKYEKELFDTFEIDRNYRRTFRADAYNPIQQVVKIPVQHLRRFSV